MSSLSVSVHSINRGLTAWLVVSIAITVAVACKQTGECHSWKIPTISELVSRHIVSTGMLILSVASYAPLRMVLVTLWFVNTTSTSMSTAIRISTFASEVLRLLSLVLLALITTKVSKSTHQVFAVLAVCGSVSKGVLRSCGEWKGDHHRKRAVVHLMLVFAAAVSLGVVASSKADDYGWLEVFGLLCISIENLFDGLDYQRYTIQTKVSEPTKKRKDTTFFSRLHSFTPL